MITSARLGIGLVLLGLWQVGSVTGVLSPLFFGRPERIAAVIGEWFGTGEIWPHLFVTISETLMAFASGTTAGVLAGLWLGLSPRTQAVLDPYIKAANAMPRVILAPIFAMWFGLGMASKVALGFTLVFFIVFFNVLQGVREVSPTVLNATRMLGATRRQLLRQVYLPAAMAWVFSSLHVSVGMAFVGAVIAEYAGTMYHCKVMTVDNLLVSVGSTNFDNRSFRLNDEATLNIIDAEFASEQTTIFETDLGRSRRISHLEWLNRPYRERATEWLALVLRSQL